MNNAKQGPMTAYQLRKVLATADNRQHDEAARWGTKETSAYYVAWLWVSSLIYGYNVRPSGNPWEPWELEGITRTIRQVQDVVALNDPA